MLGTYTVHQATPSRASPNSNSATPAAARDLSAQPQHPPPDRISPGQVLHLPDDTPTQPPRLYSVRRGDTLSGIAQRERGAASRWPESLERNREVISNPDRIFPTRSSSSRPRCLPTEVVDLS